jgi:N-methylhydantoinase A
MSNGSAVRPWRMGVDIGGTFTDGLLWNERTGVRRAAKVLTTPDDLAKGFMRVVSRLLDQAGIAADEIGYLVHATTVATNAVVQGQLRKTAYVTTAGFRDVFEIARQVRPNPYDVFAEKPAPPVPRNLCLEVDERITAEGAVLRELDGQSVEALLARLEDVGVTAVAVCLLHSYANPTHERALGQALAAGAPDLVVTLSSDIAPEFREYPRACTTVINAGLVPIVSEYLSRIEKQLVDAGLATEKLAVMQSNGGVLPFSAAGRTPVRILESGPAAGVMGAVQVTALAGMDNVISFDMGGTTAKLGLITDGVPHVSQEFEIGAESRSRDWFTGAYGYPILTPSVDLVEIGAGGGSVAWIDSGGKLRVGPRSAGAHPGPACYGFGGREATVTDANLILGRLDAARPLADGVRLDLAAATAAIDRLADQIGMSTMDVALGIVEIADAAMLRAMRTVSVQRGYDPRDFVLAAFGGAGPLHAVALAAEMGVTTVVVQPQPGIASALGLLVTDLRHEFSTTWIIPTERADQAELAALFAHLEEQALAAFRGEAFAPTAIDVRRFLDMRYDGQSYQLVVPVETADGSLDLPAAIAAFHATHERTYGYAEPREPTVIVNVRLTATGTIDKPAGLSRWPGDPNRLDGGEPVSRPVTFRGPGTVDTPVFYRPALAPGWTATGPAVIEEDDSATLVHPGWRATVGADFNLLVTAAGPGSDD